MIEPKLALKVAKRGTHVLPIAKWNDDVPSPCECVAEALADVEHRIASLVSIGGYNPKEIGAMSLNAYAYDSLISSVKLLNSALNEASKQNWQLELERNPDVVEHLPFGPETPVLGCNCPICESVRCAKV